MSRVSSLRLASVRDWLMRVRAYSTRVECWDWVKVGGDVGEGVGGAAVWRGATMQAAAAAMASAANAVIQTNSAFESGDLPSRLFLSTLVLKINFPIS